MEMFEMLERARKAYEAISDYTQEQVDKLVYDAAKKIYEEAYPLAKMAVEETGLGSVEDKIGKNEGTAAEVWNYLKDKKSVGIISEDPALGIMEVAHPIGVIGAIVPATNPTITPLCNFMHAVKCKNSIIISPAPRAEKTSVKTVELIRETLAANGAPADLIQVIENTSIAKSQELMEACDLIIATGAASLNKAAYSSGTPAYGVGPGNPPVILDRGYDVVDAAKQSVIAVGSDNGILCDGQNQLFYPQEMAAEVVEALRGEGVAVYEDEADVAKFRSAIFEESGKQAQELVGKDAVVIAKAAGFDIPEKTKIIALKSEGAGKVDILNKEIMGPVVILKGYNTFEEAVEMAVRNMHETGGTGHTAGIFSNNEEHIRYYGERIPVARVLVNQPTPDAWGPLTNALSPASSEGCGTWGNNILCGNVDYIHMLNVSKIVKPLDVEPLDYASVFK